MEAQIVLDYDDARMAEAVCNGVSPDNFKPPKGLFIKTSRQGKKVITDIKYEGRLATFVATIDDLLSFVSVAERTVRAAGKLE